MRSASTVKVASWLAAGLLFAATPASLRADANPASTAPTTGTAPDVVAAEADQPGAPVLLNGEVLFRVAGVTSYPAAERARAVEQRVHAFALDTARPVSELRLQRLPSYTLLLAGSDRIVAIHDGDALLEHVDRDTLAEVNLVRLKEAVEQFREERSTPHLLRHAGYAALATLLLVAFALGVRATGRRLRRRVEARYSRIMAELEGRSKQLVRAQWFTAALRWVVNAVSVALLVVGVLAWLMFVLEQFPWTRPFGERMVERFMAPLTAFGRSVLEALPGLAFLVVLYFLTRALLRFLRMVFDAVRSGSLRLANFDPEWAEPTYKIVRLLVVIFALVVAYPYVPGSGSEAFKGISLLLGVMLSLGSSSIISNLLAGYAMTYRRAFRRGDLVRVDDAMGVVTEQRLQVTHLRNLRNEEIIVPNSTILGSTVVNYTSIGREAGLMVQTTVGIGYETAWRQVEAMLLLAASRTPGIRSTPPAFVLITKLGDFCVSYELHAPVEDAGRPLATLAALNREVLDVFNEYGVQIMTPAYEGDPASPKIVPREQWYAAPAVPPAQPGAAT